jgi:hypothetical protein
MLHDDNFRQTQSAGHFPPASLSGVGPSATSEFQQASVAFRLRLLDGIGTTIAASAATILYNWAFPSDSLSNILSALGGPNYGNSSGNQAGIGGETAGCYLSNNNPNNLPSNFSIASNWATDVIFGSGGTDTLIVGTGSTMVDDETGTREHIFGGTGNVPSWASSQWSLAFRTKRLLSKRGIYSCDNSLKYESTEREAIRCKESCGWSAGQFCQ